jgi:hypothetical protein
VEEMRESQKSWQEEIDQHSSYYAYSLDSFQKRRPPPHVLFFKTNLDSVDGDQIPAIEISFYKKEGKNKEVVANHLLPDIATPNNTGEHLDQSSESPGLKFNFHTGKVITVEEMLGGSMHKMLFTRCEQLLPGERNHRDSFYNTARKEYEQKNSDDFNILNDARKVYQESLSKKP